VIGMKVIIDDIRKCQCEFQEDPKKPSSLSSRTLKSYQTSCNHSIERVKALEAVATNMCECCRKIEQAYQATLRSHHLLPITMRGDELVPAYEYLYYVEEMHNQLNEEI